MEKLTGEQIITILQENIDKCDFANGEFDNLGLGAYNEISYQKGDIGSTSYAHCVYLFEDHNVYIKLLGWYSSYSGGCEWEDGEYLVVEPKQKTITIWE